MRGGETAISERSEIHPVVESRRQRSKLVFDDWARMVLIDVLLNGPVTRVELAERLDLSSATITRLVSSLRSRGVLVDVETVSERRLGRPTQPLDVAASSHQFAGVRVTDEQVQVVLTDMRARVLAKINVPLMNTRPETVKEAIIHALENIGADSPAGIGVCVGGQIEAEGVVAFAPYLGWIGVDFAGMLADHLGYRVTVENDLAALTHAEHWFGRGRGVRNFAVVTLGIGIGLGIVVEGSMVNGPDFGLGLAGHLPIDASGPICPRGHRGCAKAMISSGGIAAWLSDRLGRSLDFDEAVALLRAEDREAQDVFGRAADALGAVLATVANITQAEAIIVTGEGVDLAIEGAERVLSVLEAYRNDRSDSVRIIMHQTEPEEWARAAAVTAIQDFVIDQT